LALVVDAFALVLLMLAFLFLAGAFGLVEGGNTFENIRRATFVALGLAPIIFLVGLLNARLRQASVGDLLIELSANPAPDDRCGGGSLPRGAESRDVHRTGRRELSAHH